MVIKEINITTIKKYLNNLNITQIELENLEEKNNEEITSLFRPMCLTRNGLKSGSTLLINKVWYYTNKATIDNLISFIAKNTLNSNIHIENSCFITENLIDSICQNLVLESVSLAKYDKNKYLLTNNHYLKFKQSNTVVETSGVEEDLKENFDCIIDFNYNKKLISFYTYSDLQKMNVININKKLDILELSNLKYIKESVSIKLNGDACDSFIDVLEYLKKYNKPNKIILNTRDRLTLYKYLLNNSLSNEIYVELDGVEFSSREFLEFEKTLYEAVQPAIDCDLSPFEKYIYAYNFSKKFKEYKENDNDKTSARNLYKILKNDYMVCVGFSDLFGDLLYKLGIGNIEMDLDIDISYDEKDKVIPTQRDGHSRRYVYIKDEKYNIDGFYISDPTWDNSLDKDYYSYLALTNNEILNSRRYLFIEYEDVDELFCVNNIYEFYEKINFLLDKDEYNSLEDLIYDLIDYIKILDKNYYENLKIKYSYIDDLKWPLDITDLIYDLGEYIVNHVNKPISGETIINAIKEVYKKVYKYNEDTLNDTINKIININKNKYYKFFSKIYKEYEDGRKELIDNIPNKFDIK